MAAGILVIELLGMVIAGWLVTRLKVVSEHFGRDMAAFITNVSLPCLIVTALQMEFSLSELRNCILLLALSLMYLAVTFLAGGAFSRLWPDDHRRRITRYGAMFTNFTFMGIPVIEALYGQQALFYFMIFSVPLRIALYTTAKPILTPPGIKAETRKKFGWLSPPLVAVAVGMVLYVTGCAIPAVPLQILKWMGSVCSPMGMVLCGITLGQYPLREILRPRCILMGIFRCLVLPGLLMGLALLFGASRELMIPLVITAAMPVGTLAVTFTIRYDTDPDAHFDAAGCVLISTLLSAAAIPLWAWLLGRAA